MFVIRELLQGTLGVQYPATGFWGSGATIAAATTCAANNIADECEYMVGVAYSTPEQVLAAYMQQSGATLVIAWEVQEPDHIALYLQP